MIFGDSHAGGLSSNVKNNLDDNYSVCGFVKPGVNIATQISSMTADINLLTKNDLIIFWGGSNDVSKNNSQGGLKHLFLIIIIIIFIYCNLVVTRWQWLFYMYTKLEIGYY